jgi:hypothetical protein
MDLFGDREKKVTKENVRLILSLYAYGCMYIDVYRCVSISLENQATK